jgi:hypothetical protein
MSDYSNVNESATEQMHRMFFHPKGYVYAAAYDPAGPEHMNLYKKYHDGTMEMVEPNPKYRRLTYEILQKAIEEAFE